MVDRFWETMPAALRKPTLDELYRRLKDLDHSQVDERMAVMLNALMLLESQGECRKSASEAVLIIWAIHQMEYPTRDRQGGCRGVLTEA